MYVFLYEHRAISAPLVTTHAKIKVINSRKLNEQYIEILLILNFELITFFNFHGKIELMTANEATNKQF